MATIKKTNKRTSKPSRVLLSLTILLDLEDNWICHCFSLASTEASTSLFQNLDLEPQSQVIANDSDVIGFGRFERRSSHYARSRIKQFSRELDAKQLFDTLSLKRNGKLARPNRQRDPLPKLFQVHLVKPALIAMLQKFSTLEKIHKRATFTQNEHIRTFISCLHSKICGSKEGLLKYDGKSIIIEHSTVNHSPSVVWTSCHPLHFQHKLYRI